MNNQATSGPMVLVAESNAAIKNSFLRLLSRFFGEKVGELIIFASNGTTAMELFDRYKDSLSLVVLGETLENPVFKSHSTEEDKIIGLIGLKHHIKRPCNCDHIGLKIATFFGGEQGNEISSGCLQIPKNGTARFIAAHIREKSPA